MLRLLTLATAAWAIKRPTRRRAHHRRGQRQPRHDAGRGSAPADARRDGVGRSGDPLGLLGGKGANQAVACARLVDDTIDVAFYGGVGSDTAGEVLVKELQKAASPTSVACGASRAAAARASCSWRTAAPYWCRKQGANHGWDF